MDSDSDQSEVAARSAPARKSTRAPGTLAADTRDDSLVPVVGIGASAGGLDVFKVILAELPTDTGFCFVLIQHLDPKHPSMLSEILARSTSMPVLEATDGTPLRANHIYVIPANVDLTVANRALRHNARSKTSGLHMPIDRFLRSLADQYGSMCVGVVLSGTGSDGSAGLEAIKAAGGVTFAQLGASAKFSSMPQAAIATGCVDFVLPPKEIVTELIRISRHPYIGHLTGSGYQPSLPSPAGNEIWFSNILASLLLATGIDFSLYREKMIKRRILRRLALRNITSLEEYSHRLESDADELRALKQDLLIGVTNFFRGPESFERLKDIAFPRIMQGKSANEGIRIWVAGCATGEEAFSVAIAVKEYMKEAEVSSSVQIFASDISHAAIEKARTGRFLENIEADVSPERLTRYFRKVEGGYQVGNELREMCVFTRHNLIDDPPFSKLDLITCRNVLIYLGNVQSDIIPLFHYALKSPGFLMLGGSEAVASADLFAVADREHRIYAKRETARKPRPFLAAARGARRGLTNTSAGTHAPELWNDTDMRKEVDRILLARYSPAGVVVDDGLEVIEIRGKTGPYLSLPAGKLSFNLMKLVADTGLFLEVEKLIHQAFKSGERSRQERIPYEHNGHLGSLNVEALPLDSAKQRSVLVLFEPVSYAATSEVEKSDGSFKESPRDRLIARLQQQLSEAKHRFIEAMEEHQSSREETLNTTEEALSANEELQSLNEELETAKEELQSTNEELLTVNEELQSKNASLMHARDFAMSVVETIRQPLLVLDTELRVRMANQAYYRTFQTTTPETEGRVVFSLAHGCWDTPGLRDSLSKLLEGSQAFPDFEVEQNFPTVGQRTMVIGGCRINHLKMILLAVEDITELKSSQTALRAREEHLRQSQKMEAVGRLAAGIAHDFNNLLTAILGYGSLLSEKLVNDAAALNQALAIQTAAERAAALTQHLLALSRRQVLQPKRLDLNAVVSDFERTLRRLVGDGTEVSIRTDPALWKVRFDPGEITRVLMNLSLNARDAMPDGGTLTIETANISLRVDEALALDLKPGEYVVLAVGDTGIGLDAEVQAHIFEPFFSKKESGKGTGLGLATVMGVVAQSGGAIECKSLVGEGTTFRIILPAFMEASHEPARLTSGLATAPRGSEVILLVDDEDIVRALARQILEERGYSVLEAHDRNECVELCSVFQGDIDLLVTDVVLPGLGGRELAEDAVKLRPSLRVLFMSGHSEDEVLKHSVQHGVAFLRKPFTPIALATKVRETLDMSNTKQTVPRPHPGRGE